LQEFLFFPGVEDSKNIFYNLFQIPSTLKIFINVMDGLS
jgi:hypothetical protein